MLIAFHEVLAALRDHEMRIPGDFPQMVVRIGEVRVVPAPKCVAWPHRYGGAGLLGARDDGIDLGAGARAVAERAAAKTRGRRLGQARVLRERGPLVEPEHESIALIERDV